MREGAMGVVGDRLRLSEAAVVAQVRLRDLNRAIDERILPEGFYSLDDSRHVVAGACMLMAFYMDSARQLTAEERLFIIGVAGERLRSLHDRSWPAIAEWDWTVHDGFLTIDLAPFARRTRDGLGSLAAARAHVVSDPEILGGLPTFRGTRIPVHDVAASVVAGLPMARILAAYPMLDAEKVGLAVLYAEAYPLRGRPRRAAELPEGAVLLADRRIPRPRKAG